MDPAIQADIDLIKESVLQSVRAEAIYLFGSYAYGTPQEDSDLDIYVVVPDDTVGIADLYTSIRMLLFGKKQRDMDLLIGRSSVFHRRKTWPTLEKVVAQKGTLLYGT